MSLKNQLIICTLMITTSYILLQYRPIPPRIPASIKKLSFDINDPNLKSNCPMPCVPINTTVIAKQIEIQQPIVRNSKPFVKGEKVTCIYDGIFSWSDGSQFVKTIPMKCIVLNASEVWNDLEPNYQHLEVDCSKDLATKWSSRPGLGMVKNHKLNYKTRWYSSSDCYHFQDRN